MVSYEDNMQAALMADFNKHMMSANNGSPEEIKANSADMTRQHIQSMVAGRGTQKLIERTSRESS